MTDRWFDDLTRLLAVGSASRRRLLSFGLIAAVTRFWRAPEAAAARCRNIGARCDRSRDCCPGRRCKRGRCRCRAGRKPCGRICCPAGQVCVDDRCVPPAGSCAPNANTCVDLDVSCSGGDCSCLRSASGSTRCGRIISTPCGICGEDIDCRRKFGAGTFCFVVGGNKCGCPLPTQTACARQCA